MKIKLIGIIILMSFKTVVFGQDLMRIVPPTPEATSLAKFTEVPVNKYTGTTNISIPIYEIKSGLINLPIYLKYHSRGVMVGEISPRVGLGWALDYGGAISRQVRGSEDESRYGYFKNFNDFKDVLKDEQKRQTIVNSDASYQNYDFFPDNFMISTSSGLNGSFIYDYNDGLPLLQKFNDVKVETIYNHTNANDNFYISGFKVTDSNGVIYYFGLSKDMTRSAISYEKNMRSATYFNGSISENTVPDSYYPSAWQLMEIESPTGAKIEFIYPTTPESSYYYRKGGDIVVANGVRSSFTYVQSNQYHLEEIRFDKGKIKFIPNSIEREDIVGGHDLSEIVVYDNDNNIVKEVELKYVYTNSSEENQLSYFLQVDPKAKKRMFLSRIFEKNSLKGKQLPPYVFEYDTTILPSRFSTSQDGWGYYNGADNGDYLTFFNEGNKGDNRRENSSFLTAGLLKEITYPEGGRSKFFYESNIVKTSFVSKAVLFSPQESTTIKTIQLTKKDFTHIPNVGYEKLKVKIPAPETKIQFHCIHFAVNDGNKCIKELGECDNLPGDNVPDCIFQLGFSYDGISWSPITPGSSFTMGSRDVYFSIVPLGLTDEKDELLYLKEQYDFAIEMTYEESENQAIGESVTYGGGNRIQKILTYDTADSLASSKEYSYKNSLEEPTGELLGLPSYVLKSNDNYTGSPFTLLFQHGNMPGSPLSTSQGNAVGYGLVTEYLGGQIENIGKIEYDYFLTGDSGSGYNYPYNIPNNHEWLRGANLETRFYNVGGEIMRKIENKYLYANESGGLGEYSSYGVFLSAQTYLPINRNLPIEYFQYKKNSSFYRLPLIKLILARDLRKLVLTEDLMFSDVQEDLHKKINDNYVIPDVAYYYKTFQLTGGTADLYKTIETNYLPTGNAVSTTNYQYAYEQHYQLAKMIQNDSEGRLIEQKMYYPTDKNLLSDLSNETSLAIDQLVTQNRIAQPIQVETFNKKNTSTSENKLQTQRTNFKIFDNGLVLPSAVQTSKSVESLEDRVIYHNYDVKGNPTEVSKKEGTRIVYLWGYDYTQPIAKIENATYAEVMTVLGRVVDDNLHYLQSLSESQIQTEINRVRTNLVKAQVTTYTYKPLIGVSTITDPRGEKTSFHYDDFNRLEFVKDSQGNILKEHKYNYKN